MVALSFGGERSAPLPTAIPTPHLSYDLPHPSYAGAISCAAASCHGGGEPGKTGSEYNTWIEKDPHSRAYAVLFNEVSKRIARNRQRTTRTAEIVPAHRDSLCLKCHALNIEVPERVAIASPISERVPSRDVFASQGVGCESCHGGAGNWLSTHYQPGFLEGKTREKAERHGLYPTKDLAFRVTLCTSCHVGSEHQEVDHDLIAAGHPRLMFEYTRFQRKPAYKAHWREKAYGDDFEARAWAIGQVATARASVDLLRARAERAGAKPSTWPELTEYSCYACHKALDPNRESWKSLTATDRKPGVLPWGSWTLPALPVLAIDDGDRKALKQLRELRDTMENSPAKTNEIALQCKKILPELDAWLVRLERRPFTPQQIGSLLQAVADHATTRDGKLNDLDWDGATQHFNGLASLHLGRKKADPAWAVLLADLEKQLRLPPQFNSPRDGHPAEILKLFQKLQTASRKSEPPP